MATIKHLFHINSPREKVYKAISTIEGLSNWWTTQTKGESKIDGTIEFGFSGHSTIKIKVEEMKENETVIWEYSSGFDSWAGTIMVFHLDDHDGKTRVRFEHEGWKETNDEYDAVTFTWGRYLESLRQYCQKGKGEAFGSENYRT